MANTVVDTIEKNSGTYFSDKTNGTEPIKNISNNIFDIQDRIKDTNINSIDEKMSLIQQQHLMQTVLMF